MGCARISSAGDRFRSFYVGRAELEPGARRGKPAELRVIDFMLFMLSVLSVLSVLLVNTMLATG